MWRHLNQYRHTEVKRIYKKNVKFNQLLCKDKDKMLKLQYNSNSRYKNSKIKTSKTEQTQNKSMMTDKKMKKIKNKFKNNRSKKMMWI